MVPKVLTDEQKENRVSISRELLDRVRGDPDFLEQEITGDETWVFEYDPDMKRQSSEWHTTKSPRPKKARMSKSKVKSMLIVFLTLKVLSIRSSYHPDSQRCILRESAYTAEEKSRAHPPRDRQHLGSSSR